MPYHIDLQNASSCSFIPKRKQIHLWVSAALTDCYPNAELTIRIVDKTESANLNKQFRKKEGPTNILSFPFEDPTCLPIPLLGDIVICATLLQEEAQAQGKTPDAHWAHLVIHGTLHLLGYDHQNEKEAAIMETKEIDILSRLGFSNPYLDI